MKSFAPFIFERHEARVTLRGRVLVIPDDLKRIGVTDDNKVERIYFEFPRYFDEVNDLSQFNFYINYLNAQKNPDLYHCDDLKIEEGNVVFSWETSDFLYAAKGEAKFTVRAVHKDGRALGTEIATLIIGEGLNTSKAIYEKDYDFINQQFDKLNELTKKVDAGILRLDEAKAYAESAKKDAGVALESKVKATSEANRATQEANRAESKVRTVDVAMLSVPKLKAEGNPVILDDAVGQKVMDVLPYIQQPVTFAKGSTSQDGVPTLNNRIDITHATMRNINSFKNFFDGKYKIGAYDSEGVYNPSLVNRKCTEIQQALAEKVIVSFSSDQKLIMILCTYKNGKLVKRSTTETSTILDLVGTDSFSLSWLNSVSESNGVNESLKVYIKYEKYNQEIVIPKPIKLSKWEKIEIRNGIVGVGSHNLRANFNGSESWIYLPLESVDRFALDIPHAKADSTPFSDGFRGVSSYTEKTGEMQMYKGSAGVKVIFVLEKGKFTVKTWKEYLSAHPLEVCIELSNDSFEPLPAEDQQSILNMIIQSQNATIMTDTGITLSINYIADTKTWVLKQIKSLTN